MKIKTILFLFLLSLLLLFSSCGTSGKHGVRNHRYTEARTKNKPTSRYTFIHEKENKKDVVVSTKNKNTTTKAVKPGLEFQKRNEIIASAMKFIGTPYKYAGKNPDEGFDCSGFANYIFNKNNIAISGPSYDLALVGEIRDQDDLRSGDLIFFGEKEKINHVGIVTENKNGKLSFIHSSTSSGITINEVFSSDYWSSKFLFGRDVLAAFQKEL